MRSSDSPQHETVSPNKTPGARIRRARKARDWSLQQMALQMRLYARKRGKPAPAVSSLKPMISKWEHDHSEPNESNRRLLAGALQVGVKDLGLTEDPDVIW